MVSLSSDFLSCPYVTILSTLTRIQSILFCSFWGWGEVLLSRLAVSIFSKRPTLVLLYLVVAAPTFVCHALGLFFVPLCLPARVLLGLGIAADI